MGRKSNLESQLDRIVYLVINEDYITASFVQRKLGITYISAQKILKKLAEMGYVEKYEAFKKIRVVRHKFMQ